LGICGYAKNLNDGSVFLEIESEPDKLDEFLKWCRNEVSYAEIEQLEHLEGAVKDFKDFQIL